MEIGFLEEQFQMDFLTVEYAFKWVDDVFGRNELLGGTGTAVEIDELKVG